MGLTSEDFIDNDSGFRAALYHNTADHRWVLAFSGTNVTEFNDWGANLMQFAGLVVKTLSEFRVACWCVV
jgi:hypothetical protein